MNISNELSLGDFVQTVVGVVALFISIIAYRKANHQFKENLRQSNASEERHLIESQNLLKTIDNQREFSEKQLYELLKLTKPIIDLDIYKLEIIGVEEDNTPKALRFHYIIRNEGTRSAKNVTFNVIGLDSSYGIIYNFQRILIELMHQNKKFETSFDSKISDRAINNRPGYIYFKIAWEDIELNKIEEKDYYYILRYNHLDAKIIDCAPELINKLKKSIEDQS